MWHMFLSALRRVQLKWVVQWEVRNGAREMQIILKLLKLARRIKTLTIAAAVRYGREVTALSLNFA